MFEPKHIVLGKEAYCSVTIVNGTVFHMNDESVYTPFASHSKESFSRRRRAFSLNQLLFMVAPFKSLPITWNPSGFHMIGNITFSSESPIMILMRHHQE
jgi:hypothetical protein